MNLMSEGAMEGNNCKGRQRERCLSGLYNESIRLWKSIHFTRINMIYIIILTNTLTLCLSLTVSVRACAKPVNRKPYGLKGLGSVKNDKIRRCKER